MIYFSADCHLNHWNIVKYCNRPFKSVGEMNDIIISNFNSVIKPEDTLYHLGDFCMGGNYDYISSLMNRINGKKICILGNHDKKKIFIQMAKDKVIESCHRQLKIMVNEQLILLYHYPMIEWEDSYKGSWLAFGHCHNKVQGVGLSMDVGVDGNNFFPVSFEQFASKMKEKIKAGIYK